MQTMKAVRFHAFGGPEVLAYEDAPKPEPGTGDVLVRVRAAGINPPDLYLRDGYKMLPAEWQPKIDFPAIPGTDISGVVEKPGRDVSAFSVGDEVYAMVRFPEGLAGKSAAYAQYVTVPAAQLSLKPARIDHLHAAAAPMSLLTAWQFLVDLGHDEPNPLQPQQHVPVPLAGRRVLVNGAAGGVGHFALQLAKWKGAHVTAVASGRNESFLRDLGADEFIDYSKTAPETLARDMDLVVDAVGGAKTGRFLSIIKSGGALFPIFPLGFDDQARADERDITVSSTQVRSNGAQLAETGRLVDDGTIRVAVDSVFPLADARGAHERAARGHVQGKIVFTVE